MVALHRFQQPRPLCLRYQQPFLDPVDKLSGALRGIAGGEPSYRLLSKWTELERWQAVCTYLVKLEIEIKSHRESSAVHLGSPRDTDWSKQEI